MSELAAASPPSVQKVQSVIDWLLDTSIAALPAEMLIDELCRRLAETGTEIWRCSTSLLTFHPEVATRNITWVRGEGSVIRLVPYSQLEQPGYLDSPVRVVREKGQPLRVKLAGGVDPGFGPLREIQAKGATDYAIHPLRYSDGRTTYLSFTSDAPEGFTELQLANLRQVLPSLSLRFELEASRFATECLLNVYLGRSAAERVLAGSIRRGGGERIRAAVWVCDLRGFTTLVDQRPIDEVLSVLDRYFECTAGEVLAAGGEVLKFIGDAVLAIFPIGPAGAEDACQRALNAAAAAISAMDRLNAERGGASSLGLGIAMHVGEVMYGNVGARDRLDFTVIGAAVNEVTRVESLCKPLGKSLLMSAQFVTAGKVAAQSLGTHALKGVGEQMEVFTLPA